MNKRTAHAAYVLAKADLCNGWPVEKFEKEIKDQAEKENYEFCAGIRKAIDEHKGNGNNTKNDK